MSGRTLIPATFAAEAVSGSGFVAGSGIGAGSSATVVSTASAAASGAILHHLRERGAKLDERASRVVQGYLTRSEANLRRNSAARRLRRLRYEPDLDFCLAEDTVPVVPWLSGGAFVGGGFAQQPPK